MVVVDNEAFHEAESSLGAAAGGRKEQLKICQFRCRSLERRSKEKMNVVLYAHMPTM
jgi:hypothetical protein